MFSVASFGKRRSRKKKTKRPSAALRRVCKKLGVRLTVSRGGKRHYKSTALLKKQCKNKLKTKAKGLRRRRKVSFGRSAKDCSEDCLTRLEAAGHILPSGPARVRALTDCRKNCIEAQKMRNKMHRLDPGQGRQQQKSRKKFLGLFYGKRKNRFGFKPNTTEFMGVQYPGVVEYSTGLFPTDNSAGPDATMPAYPLTPSPPPFVPGFVCRNPAAVNFGQPGQCIMRPGGYKPKHPSGLLCSDPKALNFNALGPCTYGGLVPKPPHPPGYKPPHPPGYKPPHPPGYKPLKPVF